MNVMSPKVMQTQQCVCVYPQKDPEPLYLCQYVCVFVFLDSACEHIYVKPEECSCASFRGLPFRPCQNTMCVCVCVCVQEMIYDLENNGRGRALSSLFSVSEHCRMYYCAHIMLTYHSQQYQQPFIVFVAIVHHWFNSTLSSYLKFCCSSYLPCNTPRDGCREIIMHSYYKSYRTMLTSSLLF